MVSSQESIGRYVVCDEIASGGMATVHFGRVVGPAGFSRTVAIKKMHAHYAREPQFASMFLDEARLAARIRHPNVVGSIDVVEHEGDLFIVFDYVEGETLARLESAAQSRGERIPLPFALSIAVGALSGLHAAHEATDERRDPLSIVHRDVSPQNLMVGVDGVTRVLDFGIAKAAQRLESTRGGQIKGKLRYMAPEQIRQRPLDRRVDVYAAGVVLWEVLAGRRLFAADESGAILHQILNAEIDPPSRHAAGVPEAVDAIVMQALAREPADRFATALEMAEAIERLAPPVKPREIGAWVESLASETLKKRADRIAELESSPSSAIQPDGSAARRRVTSADDATSVEAASSASLPAKPPPTPSDAVRRYAPAIVLAAALATVAVAFAQRESGAEPGGERGEERPAGVAGTTPDPSAEPVVVPSVVTASAAASATATPSEELPHTAPTQTAKPAGRPPQPPKANCSPPYVIEPDGTKRWKKHCL
jgi:serine/threonine-protein kinase